jgi:hypothetical protein
MKKTHKALDLVMHVAPFRVNGPLPTYITNFSCHDLVIIVVQKHFFHRFVLLDMDVINLFVLFKHKCHVHCLDMDVVFNSYCLDNMNL